MARRVPVILAQLEALLAHRAGWKAADLADELGVSVPSLHRMLQGLAPRVVSAGRARRTRYALDRAIRGVRHDFPVYAIDASGVAEEISTLVPITPSGTWMRLPPERWPVPEESLDGWWEGLPYPLYDMRPQGYMGRQFALLEYRLLHVPQNPEEWGDDDIVYAMSMRGADLPGNLIVGADAYELWVRSKVAGPPPIEPEVLADAYVERAEEAVSLGIPGSSAAGEFPKFSAARRADGRPTPHVLVKFSGADASTTVGRWADLLVCEHLALESIRSIPGLASTHSRVIRHGGRTFLELERFDRHGLHGRSPVCSLDMINAAFLGDASTEWPRLAARLEALGLLDEGVLAGVRRAWWFGKLIANTDMHLGNLSFVPGPKLALAPCYDMLPMLYAPLAGGEVPERVFGDPPPLPTPPQRPDWLAAHAAAVSFWLRAAEDRRISDGFRRICADNARLLQAWVALV